MRDCVCCTYEPDDKKDSENNEYIMINEYIEEEKNSFYKEWNDYLEHFYD